jgi:hypothetical protein
MDYARLGYGRLAVIILGGLVLLGDAAFILAMGSDLLQWGSH